MTETPSHRTLRRSKRFFIHVSFQSYNCCGLRYSTGSVSDLSLVNAPFPGTQVAYAIGFPTSQAMHFRPGGTMDISRWWSASVTTGVGHNRFCVPAGTPDWGA